MRSTVWLSLVLALAGCPAVQVDEINVDDPTVNVDANANANVDVKTEQPTDQPAKEPTASRSVAPRELTPAESDAPVVSDFDGDGIPDSLDPCPVDFVNDSDHDGQCDSQDPCPNDSFDDRDGDGQCDSQDPCPSGDVDSDADGVCDRDDVCPADAPNDSDSDGQCDSEDPCPLDATDDTDGDGRCDSRDACDGHDDSVDSDSDGIADGCDECPMGNNADNDGNGYPDLCDTLLATGSIYAESLLHEPVASWHFVLCLASGSCFTSPKRVGHFPELTPGASDISIDASDTNLRAELDSAAANAYPLDDPRANAGIALNQIQVDGGKSAATSASGTRGLYEASVTRTVVRARRVVERFDIDNSSIMRFRGRWELYGY